MTHYLPTLEDWRRSVAALAYQLNQLSFRSNLLGPTGTEGGKYLFSDSGVPLPRPCTIFAWASLCAVGSVRPRFHHQTGERFEPRLIDQLFVIPFLPKIRHGEDTHQSLARTSRHQVKNSLGDIRWGKIFVANSDDGTISEELSHGAMPAKHFQLIEHKSYKSRTRFPVPPLWASSGSGWEFGVIQPQESITVTLRDPFLELAKHGIPELSVAGDLSPQVRSLLIRFLEISAAQKWAKQYSESLNRVMFDSREIESDFQELLADIKTARLHEQSAKDKKSKADSSMALNLSASDTLDIRELMSQLSGDL